MKKSQIVQFLLNLVFGLGGVSLFYSSFVAGVVFTVLQVVAFGVVPLIANLALWPVVILVGFVTVAARNREARTEERRHRELVDATRDGAVRRD